MGDKGLNQNFIIAVKNRYRTGTNGSFGGPSAGGGFVTYFKVFGAYRGIF